MRLYARLFWNILIGEHVRATILEGEAYRRRERRKEQRHIVELARRDVKRVKALDRKRARDEKLRGIV
jgi:hypothetical protein